METKSIGWVGLGKMGAPMARRVLAAGFPVAVFDKDQDRAAPLARAGASIAGDPAELAARSEVICLTIPNDEALEAVLLSADGLLPHLTARHHVVEMSTVSPAASGRVAAALAQRGTEYLRAPVSGSTATAEAGRLTVLASGSAETYRASAPLFAAFATRTFLLGGGEEARFMKLALNGMVAATAGFMAEAIALGRLGDVPLSVMLDVISESVVASPLIAYKRDLILDGRYEPQFSVDQMLKDLALIGDEARRGGLDTDLLDIVVARLRRQSEAGAGAKDFFSIAG
jgi:3-hydroxyisobutyrate dehydrogenase-like beta-hydroxyacid dehydrogenase